ncbi:MAG TPA: sensor histidine kinase [Myxococcaceae bacterium]|nr:sensor histidine kinase [Myxococcaceae bacterium]
MVVATAILPVLGFAGVVVLRLANEERQASERQLRAAAKVMATALDRELAASVRTLQALAASQSLDVGDLGAFSAEARRVKDSQSAWLTVTLVNTDGTRLVHLGRRQEVGATAVEPESVRRVVETRVPTIGDIAKGRGGKWAFPIRVPVIREGALRYVVSAVIAAEGLTQVVEVDFPRVQDEYTRALVDSEGRVAYRSRNPDEFVGTQLPRALLERLRGAPDDVFRQRTLEGTDAYVGLSRSELSGWIASVGVPAAVLEDPFRHSLFVLGVGGLLAIVLSVSGAVFLTRRFSRDLRSMTVAAAEMARGSEPILGTSSISEVQWLGESLAVSGSLLRQRDADERRAHAELQEAIRARDEFLSLASHELKTPLTSLALHAKILESTLEGGGTASAQAAQRFLEQTNKQTSRLSRLVNDMLDISRIGAGKLSLERERFDLGALVAEVVGRVQPLLAEAGCEARIEVDDPVVGFWDRFRIDQVVTNLLTNAIRYGEGHPIDIAIRKEGSSAVLQVRDRGRGIALEDQERIFRKFERAVRGSDASGLGLGLFIVQEIVRVHGGTVRVESRPGEGSTFLVELPR